MQAPLAHEETIRRVIAERTVVRRLDGGCDVPIASLAVAEGDSIWLRARVGSPDGKTVTRLGARGSEPEALGLEVADALIAKGSRNFESSAIVKRVVVTRSVEDVDRLAERLTSDGHLA